MGDRPAREVAIVTGGASGIGASTCRPIVEVTTEEGWGLIFATNDKVVGSATGSSCNPGRQRSK